MYHILTTLFKHSVKLFYSNEYLSLYLMILYLLCNQCVHTVLRVFVYVSFL